MLSSPRNSVTHNQQAKLAVDYNELLKELSSHEMTSVGCYTIGETIGEGTFGKVKKGYHKLTGRTVAIKKISKQHSAILAREIHHHKQIKHPNVVMLYEMITTESTIHIISEYCPNGDLLDALTDSGRCSEIRVHKWFRQLTDAIKYCHLRGIVHRDLKLENILLDADDNVKICDFGFARYTQKNQYLETFCGSLSYSAPEVILRKKYTGPETDIWSLGIILFTLLAGEYPFDDDNEIMTQRKIVQVEYEMPYYFAPQLKDLIDKMLQLEPSKRITVDNIIDHDWMLFHDEDEEDLMSEGCLTPSSSTTTNQSNSDLDSIFSNNSTNSTLELHTEEVATSISPDFKFSPQVRSSLGISTTNKQPRFSAPTFKKSTNSPLLQSTFRTSLPSSFTFNRERDSGVFANQELNMSPMEQRLFVALTAAGFDKDALIKMQTGECDTSSTLWHLLLENMSTKSSSPVLNVPDAFVSAIQSKSSKSESRRVDCATQTTSKDIQQPAIIPLPTPPPAVVEEFIQPYPKPAMNKPQNTIQTVGFGSTTMYDHSNSSSSTHSKDRSGWFTSVKSWFGTKQQQQQQLLMMEQQNELILQHQLKQQQPNRSFSNCSTMSSPISTPSSYRNFDAAVVQDDIITPIYRTGSQKYRRRQLQLAEPIQSELDQLTYNNHTIINNKKTKNYTHSLNHYTKQQREDIIQLNLPPTALSRSQLADTLILSPTKPKEVDIVADTKNNRQSVLFPPLVSTPPPSPPINEKDHAMKQQLSDFSSDCSSSEEDEEEVVEELQVKEEPVISSFAKLPPVPPPQLDTSPPTRSLPSVPQPPSTSSPTTDFSNPNRLSPLLPQRNFTARSRLSIYGMQNEVRVPSSKTIIEEEEEEEE